VTLIDVTRLERSESDKMAMVLRKERGATRREKSDAIGLGCQDI